MYYDNGGECIGVAVSDSPTGVFIDANNQPLVDLSTPGVLLIDSNNQPIKNKKNTHSLLGSENWGMWCFDPSVLIDDDSSVYILWWSSSH